MSQIAQLSEAEIEERFHITGTRPVAFMLAGFAKDNEQFSVMFQAGQEMYLTTLLAVKPEKGLFIFDCSGGGSIASVSPGGSAGVAALVGKRLSETFQ